MYAQWIRKCYRENGRKCHRSCSFQKFCLPLEVHHIPLFSSLFLDWIIICWVQIEIVQRTFILDHKISSSAWQSQKKKHQLNKIHKINIYIFKYNILVIYIFILKTTCKYSKEGNIQGGQLMDLCRQEQEISPRNSDSGLKWNV